MIHYLVSYDCHCHSSLKTGLRLERLLKLLAL